ncbi:MAG: hypothetical protein WAT39_22105 [Planctomycetota bacterium]
MLVPRRTLTPQFLAPGVLAAIASLAVAQTSHDIPHRGAHVYRRTTDQWEVTGPPSRLRPEWLVHDGGTTAPTAFRYYTCPANGVPAGFEAPQFDDSGWLVGQGEFGTEVGKDPQQRTAWQNAVVCLRLRAELGAKKPKALWFQLDHDDGVRVWLNGKLAVADDGYGRGRSYVVTGQALEAWQAGENVLAVKCTNTGGAQYCDLGVAAFTAFPPGVRTAEDLQRVVREDSESANKVRGDLFGAFRPPALLLQGELDGKDQFVVIPPGDLRDLAWWVAMDLRPGLLGGAVQAEAWRLFRLGDLAVRGKASAVEPDGWQTLELTVKNTAEPGLRGDSKRHVERYVRPHVLYGFDGDLVVKRRLEVKDGKAKVAEFTSELRGTVLRGKDWKEAAATLRQRERWSWDATRDNQDVEFRTMVAAALKKGTERLRADLKDPAAGILAPDGPDADRSYQTGRLALGLLALVKGGVAKDDEVVRRGYEVLRTRKLVDTYSLANAIMAVEALYTPGSEAGDIRTGTIDRPRKRQPSAPDKKLLEQWAAQLLANHDTRVDPAYLLRFNYTAGDRFDNSVNQYGLLGLYSAHLCGVEIKAVTWEAAANHLLGCQSEGGDKLELELVDYRTLARRQASPDEVFTVGKSFARANGWSYHEGKDQGELTPTWGSMTAAGITGLAICAAGVLDHPQLKRPKLLGDASRARDDGFAWLAKWMTPRQHAGAIERQQHWIYYYLYSLERAALLSGIALIQDRDWYFEGAMVLVLAQQADGHWPGELLWDQGIERDAMAILFLKQSTAPVLTGR